MLNFLKNKFNSNTSVFEIEKSNNVIKEIHHTFDTEVDRLFETAKVMNSLETDKSELIDKCHRLKSKGFHSTKEVVESEAEIKRLNNLETENKNKQSLIDAINYFIFNYPNYKFITEDSVKKICAKYNLVYSKVNNYIGTVPDKNLKHIEEFKIKEDDECYEKTFVGGWKRRKIHATFISYVEHKKIQNENLRKIFSLYDTDDSEKCPLEIVAPLKDFNAHNMNLEGFKLSEKVILDPIVLCPVIYKNSKHYLIVTAWGLEGEDELVVNHKMN